jgi:hypothetical protein
MSGGISDGNSDGNDDSRQHPSAAVATYSRRFGLSWASVTPEKRKLNVYGASPPRHAASQISRTGRWPPGKSSRRV